MHTLPSACGPPAVQWRHNATHRNALDRGPGAGGDAPTRSARCAFAGCSRHDGEKTARPIADAGRSRQSARALGRAVTERNAEYDGAIGVTVAESSRDPTSGFGAGGTIDRDAASNCRPWVAWKT